MQMRVDGSVKTQLSKDRHRQTNKLRSLDSCVLIHPQLQM